MIPAALIVLALSGQAADDGGGQVQAWIEANRSDGMVELAPSAGSAEALTVTYELQVESHSGGNVSRTRQSGRAELQAGEPARLARSAVNDPGEGVIARLIIRDEQGRILAEAEWPGGEGG